MAEHQSCFDCPFYNVRLVDKKTVYCLRRNGKYSNESFRAKLKAMGIKEEPLEKCDNRWQLLVLQNKG